MGFAAMGNKATKKPFFQTLWLNNYRISCDLNSPGQEDLEVNQKRLRAAQNNKPWALDFYIILSSLPSQQVTDRQMTPLRKGKKTKQTNKNNFFFNYAKHIFKRMFWQI